jgi:APA family basic amino acid/polyamine antiporter
MALANDGHLPKALKDFRPAIVVSTAFACGLAIMLGYASLVDVSNVVILSGYALTCLATLILRFRKPDLARRYRAPKAVPLLAFCAAIALLAFARPGANEWIFSAELLAIGLVIRVIVGLAIR